MKPAVFVIGIILLFMPLAGVSDSPQVENSPTDQWINIYCSSSSIMNGQNLSEGAVIMALDPDGVICGIDTVDVDGHFGFMQIYKDDPETPVDEGADDGDTIAFIITGPLLKSEPVVMWNKDNDPYDVCEFYNDDCGDANSDGRVNVSDAIYIVNYIFIGGDEPYPLKACDMDCDGSCIITDAVRILHYVFNNVHYPCDTDNDMVPDC